MTTLLIVRHGETEENVSRILQGHLPGKLTARGIQQAEALAQALKGETFDVLLTSDLARAHRTACIIGKALSLQPIQDSRLRERDWGTLTGRAIDSLKGDPFPDSVETVTAMTHRAMEVLDYIYNMYRNKCVLCVTHGLFARTLQAAYYGVRLREIEPMQNGETRQLLLPRPTHKQASPAEDANASAN
ncbi:MAG: histidine phosphatase family protein [Alloprevotella sp.]|nr:histidine phosphatase family protein [Alloprevotella sp.]